MNKQIISLFSFGIFLVIIGAIGKIMDWNQSNLIMAIGLLFELLAAILFIWQKIKK
ncbi:MAG: gliding motility protein GldL [Flavobacteriaceae bacterium]|nr:MAG: gliding motility protein GldL [Flavobacteriaceae bacterium]